MRKEFTIYYTSDTHGHIFPVDYASGQPEASGLLNMASVIKKDGNTLTLDRCVLQGTPLTAYYLEHRQDWPLHPVAEAFRAMGLDYFTLGNHDFNYGYQTLKGVPGSGGRCLPLRQCGGCKGGAGASEGDCACAGKRPSDRPDRRGHRLRECLGGALQSEGLRITDPFEAAKAACGRLKGRCDVCVCMYHGGFEKDLRDRAYPFSNSRENIACRLGEELDFDLLLTGHQHMAVEGVALAGAWAVQPPANAGKLLLIQGELQENMKKGFPKGFHSEFLDAGTKTSAEPYARLLPLEKQVQAWLDLPVGGLKEAIPPEGKLEGGLRGSRLADLFNQVQLEATGADFSCTSLGNEPVGLSEAVTMRGITASLSLLQYADGSGGDGRGAAGLPGALRLLSGAPGRKALHLRCIFKAQDRAL